LVQSRFTLQHETDAASLLRPRDSEASLASHKKLPSPAILALRLR